MSLAIISFASIFIHSNGFELNQAEAQVQSSFWLMLPMLSPGFEPLEPVQAPATAATKKRLFLFSSEQTQMALLSIFLVTSRHVGLQKETQPGKKLLRVSQKINVSESASVLLGRLSIFKP